MKKEKLKWFIVDNNYINYLRIYEDKVEKIDYEERIKPYIGIIIEIEKFKYYVPISSPKEKHYKMKENMDFIKIMKNDKILGVLNINNMIPILNDNIQELKYSKLEIYKKFKSVKEKNSYISLLNLEINLINKKIDKIKESAYKLYKERTNNPNSRISKRCCNYKLLEEKSILYNIKTMKDIKTS